MAKAKKYECRGELLGDFIERYQTVKTQKAKENAVKNFLKNWEEVKDLHKQVNGKIVKDTAVKSAEDFLKLLVALGKMQGVECELSGDWLYVSGNTYKYRTEFMNHKMFWHKIKRCWVWQPGKVKHYNKPVKKEEENAG